MEAVAALAEVRVRALLAGAQVQLEGMSLTELMPQQEALPLEVAGICRVVKVGIQSRRINTAFIMVEPAGEIRSVLVGMEGIHQLVLLGLDMVLAVAALAALVFMLVVLGLLAS
jgi:hypothetical protein